MKFLTELIDVLKTAKRGSRRLKACPSCGSSEVVSSSSLGGWLTPVEYTCLKCGYTGTIIMEVDTAKEGDESHVDRGEV